MAEPRGISCTAPRSRWPVPSVPRIDPDRVSPPKVPVVCAESCSITFTAEGNPDVRPSVLAPEIKLVNQDKYAKLGRIAIDFTKYQQVSSREVYSLTLSRSTFTNLKPCKCFCGGYWLNEAVILSMRCTGRAVCDAYAP